jgi:hypothetical protein
MILGAFLVIGVPYMSHRDQINTTIENILYFYPEELVVTIQDGKASTNVPEPYFIKFNDVIPTENWNSSFKEGFEEGVAMDADANLEEFNLLVIDTKTPFSAEQFKDYHALVWLTEDAVYTLSENDRTESTPLADSDDMIINKTMADTGMDTIWSGVKASYLSWSPLFSFCFPIHRPRPHDLPFDLRTLHAHCFQRHEAALRLRRRLQNWLLRHLSQLPSHHRLYGVWPPRILPHVHHH